MLDIAGSSNNFPFRRVDFGGGAGSSCTAGCREEVSTFCLLLRRLTEGGLDSLEGSVWPESRWPATLRFRDETVVGGGSGAAMGGSAAAFAEERVTLEDISR